MPEKKLKIREECKTCLFFSGSNPKDAACSVGKDPTCYRKKKFCVKHKMQSNSLDTGSEENKLKKAVAYTDGSFNKNTGYYGYGMVLTVDNGEKLTAYGQGYDTHGGWQIEGELTAAKTACEKAIELGCDELEIRYDYFGVEKWVTGEWRTNKSYTKEYAECMKKYQEKINIRFCRVRAHSGDEENDRADLLAKKACGLR